MSFEEIARMFLGAVTSELDTYTSIKGEIVKNSSSSFSLLTPEHIHFAKNGRAPGKNPPLEAMLQFIRSKNILFDNMDEKGTAFPIMVCKFNTGHQLGIGVVSGNAPSAA